MLLFACLFTIIVVGCLIAAVWQEINFVKRSNAYKEFHAVRYKDDELLLGENAIKYSDIIDIVVVNDPGGPKYQEEYFLGTPGRYNYTIILKLKNNTEKYLRAYANADIRHFFNKIKKNGGIISFPTTNLNIWLRLNPIISDVLIILFLMLLVYLFLRASVVVNP